MNLPVPYTLLLSCHIPTSSYLHPHEEPSPKPKYPTALLSFNCNNIIKLCSYNLLLVCFVCKQ